MIIASSLVLIVCGCLLALLGINLALGALTALGGFICGIGTILFALAAHDALPRTRRATDAA